MHDHYFEDFPKGWRFTTRGATLSEAQILDFAWQYDPQPFHLDKTAAEKWAYGGLIASGWQTLLVGFRLVFQEGLFNASSLGSPGMQEVHWLKPVRPGDTIRTSLEVMEARHSQSKPDRGLVTFHYQIHHQNDELVADFTAVQIVLRRPPTG